VNFGAYLSDADLSGAYFSQAELEGTIGDGSTLLPSYLKPPPTAAWRLMY
jgi:uncharacterized protein YjbI with pentapeptide repeats